MAYSWPQIVRTTRGAGIPRDRCVIAAGVTRLRSALQCVTLLTLSNCLITGFQTRATSSQGSCDVTTSLYRCDIPYYYFLYECLVTIYVFTVSSC
jgi:hypothetical protein